MNSKPPSVNLLLTSVETPKASSGTPMTKERKSNRPRPGQITMASVKTRSKKPREDSWYRIILLGNHEKKIVDCKAR